MSQFNKMRLISGISDPTNNKQKIMSYSTPSSVQRMSDLDSEINSILNSSIDEREKARLYSQALRKFLIFKQKFEGEKEIEKQKELDYLTKVFIKPAKLFQTSKTKKKKKKPFSTSHVDRSLISKRVT